MFVSLAIKGINPTPWQAPELSVGRGRGGKFYPQAHSPIDLRMYKEGIAESIVAEYPDLAHEPVFEPGTPIIASFWFWRQIETYEHRGRMQTGKHADWTNLTKSTEDALQGLIYHNDTDTMGGLGYIVGQGIDIEPFIVVMAYDQAIAGVDADRIFRPSYASDIAHGHYDFFESNPTRTVHMEVLPCPPTFPF